MLEITHIKWDKRRIGIALYKMNEGDTPVKITVKTKDNNYLVPNPFLVNKQKAIKLYGINDIQNNGMKGIWVPLKDIGTVWKIL